MIRFMIYDRFEVFVQIFGHFWYKKLEKEKKKKKTSRGKTTTLKTLKWIQIR